MIDCWILVVWLSVCYFRKSNFLIISVVALNSQFSILNSQLSILNSQFSILNSQFSILNSQLTI